MSTINCCVISYFTNCGGTGKAHSLSYTFPCGYVAWDTGMCLQNVDSIVGNFSRVNQEPHNMVAI